MRNLLLWSFPLLAAGCAVGPDYQPPRTAVPAAYPASARANAIASDASVDLARWWTVFGDPRLDSLIRCAASSNLEVRLAIARVREARAQRGVVRADWFPRVGAEGAYARNRFSENSPVGRAIGGAGQPLENDLFDAALDMTWEIDVFGGTRRAVEAATARYEASLESNRDALITVLAEVGLNYLDLRGAQRELAVARRNLRLQEDTLTLTRDRFQAGLTSELDTARAEAQVASTRARIPPLEEARQRAIHRLGVLLGQAPGELEATLIVDAPLPSAVPRVPLGLPSDLLRRRPDLRAAERELAAATARVGVATAELFPKFYLTAAAGLESVEASDFFDAGSRFWSLGPSVRWPVFNAGKLRRNVEVQNARQEQALLRYEQAVLVALEEVQNALVAFGQEQERRAALLDSERATRRSVALADERYRGGLADFLDVLETERSLLAVESALAGSETLAGQHLVRVFKSLGGGWEESRASTPGTPEISAASANPLRHESFADIGVPNSSPKGGRE